MLLKNCLFLYIFLKYMLYMFCLNRKDHIIWKLFNCYIKTSSSDFVQAFHRLLYIQGIDFIAEQRHFVFVSPMTVQNKVWPKHFSCLALASMDFFDFFIVILFYMN